MPDRQPYCDYRMTVRIEIPHQPGQFARLTTALAEENANLGAIDIVEVKRERMVSFRLAKGRRTVPRGCRYCAAQWQSV